MSESLATRRRASINITGERTVALLDIDRGRFYPSPGSPLNEKPKILKNTLRVGQGALFERNISNREAFVLSFGQTLRLASPLYK